MKLQWVIEDFLFCISIWLISDSFQGCLQIDSAQIKKIIFISFETQDKFETFLKLRKIYSFHSFFFFSSLLGLQQEIERGSIWRTVLMF